MDIFDYKWNGIEFAMCLKFVDQEGSTHWTDLCFYDEAGTVDGDEVYIGYFTPEAKDDIRKGAYHYWLENQPSDIPDDIDRECHEYHINKED